jgi:hypothetical protein
VSPIASLLGGDLIKPGREVHANAWVGVFIERQRGTRVEDLRVHEPSGKPRDLRHCPDDLSGDQVQATPLGG